MSDPCEGGPNLFPSNKSWLNERNVFRFTVVLKVKHCPAILAKSEE